MGGDGPRGADAADTVVLRLRERVVALGADLPRKQYAVDGLNPGREEGVTSMPACHQKCLLSWSSGKDSAWALRKLRDADVEVVGLLTTLNQAFDRVAMHAVRRDLLESQARAATLPLWPVPLPWPCSNQEYERIMAEVCQRIRDTGIEAIAFGDLYLADVRAYRERQLQGTGLTPLFPLWGLPTDALAREMVAGGLKAKLTCVDPKMLPAGFAGREFDEALLADLPQGVDPCGENGEFHTFAYDGPMFREPIPVSHGEVVQRDGFVFADFSLPVVAGERPAIWWE
jgi:uncharacterized protein (TIGR00290 family)